jgi:hypothetical protein
MGQRASLTTSSSVSEPAAVDVSFPRSGLDVTRDASYELATGVLGGANQRRAHRSRCAVHGPGPRNPGEIRRRVISLLSDSSGLAVRKESATKRTLLSVEAGASKRVGRGPNETKGTPCPRPPHLGVAGSQAYEPQRPALAGRLEEDQSRGQSK